MSPSLHHKVVLQKVTSVLNRLIRNGSGVLQNQLALCHTSTKVKNSVNENHTLIFYDDQKSFLTYIL